MIDSIAVVQRGASPRAIAQPPEVVAGDRVPAVRGHAPVLTGSTERVRRDAGRRVEVKVRLARPDVGAVAVDHEWQIPEKLDAETPCSGARSSPLFVGDPLEVLPEQNVVAQFLAGVR